MSTSSLLTKTVTRALRLKHHRPSFIVNRTMTALVTQVTHANDDTWQDELPRQASIRKLGSSTEYELEQYWSQKIARAKHPAKTLSTFPYKRNYEQLVKREVDLLRDSELSLTFEHSVLIIGSGPLPLTGLELARQTGARVTLLDSSKQAITSSQQLLSALGIRLTHVHAAGETVALTVSFDVIILAALAGSNHTEKQRIIRNVLPRLSPHGRILARSAHGSRSLLYPIISEPFDGLELIKEHHPTDDIINSILIYRRTNEA